MIFLGLEAKKTVRNFPLKTHLFLQVCSLCIQKQAAFTDERPLGQGFSSEMTMLFTKLAMI